MKSTEKNSADVAVISALSTAGIGAGDHILASCSGGVDSTALLILLKKASFRLNFTLHTLYINHGIRSAEENSLDESTFRRNCHLLAVDYHIRSIQGGKLKALAVQRGDSLENVARQNRYQLVVKVAQHLGIRAVCTGHHADDQAETVLMRFLEGGSAAGLRGIPRKRGIFLRPLIEIRKRDLYTTVTESGLLWNEDATNHDTDMRRNLIRKELIPMLSQSFPGIHHTLLGWSDYFNDIQRQLTSRLDEIIGWEREGQSLQISRGADFADLSYEQKKMFLLRALNGADSGYGDRIPDRLFREITRAPDDHWSFQLKKGWFHYRRPHLFYYRPSLELRGEALRLRRNETYYSSGICFYLTELYNDNINSQLMGTLDSDYIMRSRMPGDYIRKETGRRSLKDFLRKSGLYDFEWGSLRVIARGGEVHAVISERLGVLISETEERGRSLYFVQKTQ